MTLLSWQDEYNINVAQIDDQHRQMLSIALDLHAAVTAQRSNATLLKILKKLMKFSRMHFAFEETLMVEHSYPELKTHQEEHAALMQRLEVFHQSLENGRLLQLSPITDITDDLVLAHVDGADRKLGEFLNKQQVF